MSIYNASAGYSFAPSYQLSGLPYVTGVGAVTTRYKIELPYVAQWICLRFTQSARKAFISFDSSGSPTNNTIQLESDASTMFFGPYDLRIKDLYIESTDGVYLIAGLTTIPRNSAPSLISPINGSVTGSLSATDTNYFIYPGI